MSEITKDLQIKFYLSGYLEKICKEKKERKKIQGNLSFGYVSTSREGFI